MISRLTSSVPKEDVGSPRLLYSRLRCSLALRQRSQVIPGLLSALPVLSPVIPGASRCTWRPLRRSSTLWDFTTLGFSSDNSQTLPEAPSEILTSCWCDEGRLVAVDLVGWMLWSDGLSQGALRMVQMKHVYSVMLATVEESPSRSEFRSEPNRWHIGGPGHQYTWTVYWGMFWWKSPTPCELGGLSAGCTAGLSVNSYNALACAVW